jgi:aspartyl protease family protein
MSPPRLLAPLLLLATLVGARALAAEITVLGLFKDKAILQVDGKQRVLAKGEQSPEGIKLVSADSEQAVLEIDGEQKSYKLGTHIGTTYAKPAAGPAVQVWPDAGGMYSVVGSINGYPVNFLVDTGATVVALNRTQARRLGIDYLVEGISGQSATASGVVATYHVVLDRVRVGDIALEDVEAAVVDDDYPLEVLLGNSFLNRVDMRREGMMLELRTKP